MKVYVNMLFIMNDISPVENNPPVDPLDSVDKPSQDIIKGIFNSAIQLAEKPGIPLYFTPEPKLTVLSDSKFVPIVINQMPASLYVYGPKTRAIDKFLPSFQIVVNKKITEPNKPYAIRNRSYDSGEESDKDERFSIEAFDDIDIPHDPSQKKGKGPGLINRRLSHDYLRIIQTKIGMTFVGKEEAETLLTDLQGAR